MGFGLLFKVDKESAKRHVDERRIKVQDLTHQSIQETSMKDIEEPKNEK